jgi:hypothetical protein
VVSVSGSISRIAAPDAGWRFTLVPAAGEGGGSFVASSRRVPEYVARGMAADPERSAVEAGRRAKSRLRRYCAANRLNRLGTLTYAGTGNHDPQLLREHLSAFFRELRSRLGGPPLPYAWVPEWHKTDHGLHAHFALGRYVARSELVASWPHGFVHIKLIGDLPTGSTRLSEARIAAGYLAKYVGKSFDDHRNRLAGLHRYDVAEGFQPERIRFDGTSAGDVIAQASDLLRAHPSHLWSSDQADEWQGPPTLWAQWGR